MAAEMPIPEHRFHGTEISAAERVDQVPVLMLRFRAIVPKAI